MSIKIDKGIPLTPIVNQSDKYAWVDKIENGDSVVFATQSEAIAAVSAITQRNKSHSRMFEDDIRCARRTLPTGENRVWFFIEERTF
jgi:hypothetical protein